MKKCGWCKETKLLDEFHDHPQGYLGKYFLCIECHRLRNKLYKYGLTLDKLTTIMKSQNNGCAICKVSFDILGPRNIHIDHDHKTNLVRGVLCGSCNRGLGHFKDSPEYIRSAAAYLEANRVVAAKEL